MSEFDFVPDPFCDVFALRKLVYDHAYPPISNDAELKETFEEGQADPHGQPYSNLLKAGAVTAFAEKFRDEIHHLTLPTGEHHLCRSS